MFEDVSACGKKLRLVRLGGALIKG
jgi:hypothetical protein